MFSWHTAALIFMFFFYHPPDFSMKHRVDGKTKLQLLGELDYVGIFLFIAGGVLFLLGVNFGGRQYPWSHAGTITPIVLGLTCYIVLGFWEAYADLKYPLLQPRLFKKVRAFVMVIVVCFVGGMLYYSMNVLWPRQSQLFFVSADQPILRGAYATFFSCGTFCKLLQENILYMIGLTEPFLAGGLIMVFICSRIGHEKWQLVFFMIAQTALIGSLASVGINDAVQAVVTIIIGAATVTTPQLISFTMLSLGLEDQTDM